MKRTISSSILLLLLILVTTVPARSAWPKDFLDTEGQLTGNASVEWPEHYVFYKQYFNAMFTSGRYFTWYAPSSINSYVRTANARWNNVRPTDVEASVEVSSAGAADVEYVDGQCPVAGVPACTRPTVWGSNSGKNINWIYKYKVHISATSFVYSWTDEGKRAILTHETGHVWGLGEQYTALGTCNYLGGSSVMDAMTEDSFGRIIPCDTEYVTTGDIGRFSYYYLGGGYDAYDIQVSGAQVNATWKDASWMDQYGEMYWYWMDCPGCAMNYITTSIGNSTDNGSHRFVYVAMNRVLTSSYSPSIHGKYITVCGWPIFNDQLSHGDWRCNYSVYFP